MAVKFTLKELKERMEDNELDLGLSSLTENDLPLKEMVCHVTVSVTVSFSL